MKITIETTEKVTKELEVKLPYYSRCANLFYYKVIAENLLLKVTLERDGNCQIDLTKYCIDFAFRDDTVEIEPAEFNEALTKVALILTNS